MDPRKQYPSNEIVRRSPQEILNEIAALTSKAPKSFRACEG
jgi:hypothetical protein